MRQPRFLVALCFVVLIAGSAASGAEQEGSREKKLAAPASATASTATVAPAKPAAKPTTTSVVSTGGSTQPAMQTTATATAAPTVTAPAPVATSATTSTASTMTSPQAVATSPLEGMTWQVKVTPDAATAQKGEKPFDDTLIFQDGKVTMTACAKAGFASSAYTASPAGDTWSLTTQQMSNDQGETKWIANLSGNSIKGELIWTKQDGTILHYTFAGKKTAKSSAL